MEHWLEKMSGLIWSDVFIVLCVFTGIYFSIRLGFPQFTQVREMLRLLFQEKESEKGLSSFQAFSLAISGRVGTGNIVGVATAIAMGGPGSIFWMWLIAILGSASAFIESTLGQVYKREIDGEYRGGPAYYIEKGLGIRWYAILFAVIAVVCCGFLLPGVQSNSIAQSMNNAFGIVTQTDYFIPFNIFGAVVVGLLVIGSLSMPTVVRKGIQYRNLRVNKVLVSSSFFVYAFHLFIIVPFNKLWPMIVPVNSWTASIMLIVIPVIVSSICVCVYCVIKRYCSTLTELMVGGR